MNLENNEIEKNPPEKEIKLILSLFKLNKLKQAENEANKQITKYPKSSVLYNILGAILAGKNKLYEAIDYYEKSLKININYAQAHNNLGTAFHKINKIDKAITSYEKAITLKKEFPEAYNNLGNAYVDLNKSKDSLKYFKKALELNPSYAEAYNGMGAANEKLGNSSDALKNYQHAVKIRPNYAEAYNNIGKIFSDKSNFEEALFNYNKAVEANPNYEKTYNNLGNLFNNLGEFDKATEAYQKAINIKPDYPKAYSNLLFNLIYKTNFDINFYLDEAKKFGKNCNRAKKDSTINYKYNNKPEKLKIGFITSDFGNHPGGFFTLSFLRELRKKNLDLIAYPTIERKDEMSHHFKPLFTKWNLIERKSDEEVAKEILDDEVHILIDAQGHSAKNRLPIFFYKSAPIQITWLGQGSTGMSEIDYFIGSNHITPKNEDHHYVEKVFRLPGISQCFTPPDFNVEVNELPAIKNNFITFGSANKLAKVNDDVIFLWSKILKSVPNSKILLKNKDLDNFKIKHNIISKFEKNEISKDRLILEGESKTRRELLATYNKIDIGLDPFPFQGNTTTIESVWMGVPVIILKGDRYIFHFGESINHHLNMSDWIAEDNKNYITKAIKFSSNLKELSDIRKNLRTKALKSAIFDSESFADNFEKMLWKIWGDSRLKENK